jgi:hypothetical protein
MLLNERFAAILTTARLTPTACSRHNSSHLKTRPAAVRHLLHRKSRASSAESRDYVNRAVTGIVYSYGTAPLRAPPRRIRAEICLVDV